MIIGHKIEQKKLKILNEKNKIPHSLLFSGPESIGKRTVAFWFLKMINCKEKKPPCEKCESCLEINNGTHPDIIEVFPEKKEITISQVTQIIERISFRRIKARIKGVIINEAHLANIQAQNALLKTLEEPYDNTVIILITQYPHILFPTVLSRSFQIKFFLVSEEDIYKKIKDKEVVKLSNGRPGKAIEYINFPELKKKAQKIKKEISDLKGKEIFFKFDAIKKIIEEEREKEFLDELLRFAKDELSFRIKNRKNVHDIVHFCKEVEDGIFFYSKTAVNKKLLLEKIILKM